MAEVETARDGAVLTVTLNRPDVLNALNAATLQQLETALRAARADDVRAVVITGTGRGFCVGQARAFEWLCSGRRLTAAEAQQWGVVSEVVEAEALAARASEVASELATLPTRAIGMTKRLLDRASTATLDDQLEWEAELQTAATQTEDFREGVAAFLGKRPPSFEGR